jgi:hypothetical protein
MNSSSLEEGRVNGLGGLRVVVAVDVGLEGLFGLFVFGLPFGDMMFSVVEWDNI